MPFVVTSDVLPQINAVKLNVAVDEVAEKLLDDVVKASIFVQQLSFVRADLFNHILLLGFVSSFPNGTATSFTFRLLAGKL